MVHEEKTVKQNVIYKGKILTLRVDDALLPDGKPCVREIVDHSGGACALFVQDNKAVFVRQYRYAYGESIYEIPAGKLNVGEDPKLAALRELEEETGIRAKRAELICVMYPTPGYTNEKIYVYRAYDGEQTDAHLDEEEFLDAEWIDLSTVKEMIKKGEIKDGKTLIALQAYFLEENK